MFDTIRSSRVSTKDNDVGTYSIPINSDLINTNIFNDKIITSYLENKYQFILN